MRCQLEDRASGRREIIQADNLAGCEGARGPIRPKLGIRYSGDGGAARDFMGGRMMTVHIHAPGLYAHINGAPAWQYWSVNRERRALLIAIDGPALLASYESERKPVAERNTLDARPMADRVGGVPMPEWLEDDTATGATARRELGARLQAHAAAEFGTTGLQLAVIYANSPLVAPLDETLPEAMPTRCTPSVDTLRRGAAQRDVPLTVADIPDPAAGDVYAPDLVLVRPDRHIAWRGSTPPAEADALWRHATGFAAVS